MIISINGQWNGTIIYGPEYDDLENKELYFSLDIVQTADTFTGVAQDTGGIGVNPDKALITGFLEGNSISFSKQYQSTLILEHDGTEILQKNKPGPEINYWGTYDPLTNTLEGNWEISLYPEKVGMEYLETVFTGTWALNRI